MAMLAQDRPTGRAKRAVARAARDRNAQIAAGAAAAAGAAVAADKAGLDQLRERKDGSSGPSRAYRLKSKEKPSDGIRRIAAGRADDAAEQLRDGIGSDFDAAIHETRKDLKKLRSVLRLVRDEVGERTYRRENDRFRDAGRLLAGFRDAEVKLQTVALLEERFEDDFDGDRFAGFCDALAEERKQIAADDGKRDKATAGAAREIQIGRTMVDEWRLESNGWGLVEGGLTRGYRRGRKRFQATRAEPSAENVHEWRKRVKDLWYHLRLLRESWPSLLTETADQAHDLSDLLGDHHDLAVLAQDASDHRKSFERRKDLDSLRKLIGRRQQELLESALDLGERLYAEKPKRFSARLGSYWAAWR
jgi:CHAD domain-containing protein